MTRNWTLIAFLIILLAGITKAGYHFIRLALLAGMGLIGMWLLHKLAQDYNKINSGTKAVKAAGRLLGIWKRSIPDNENIFDRISVNFRDTIDPLLLFNDRITRYEDGDVSLNIHPSFDNILYFDQNECARRLVCQLATRKQNNKNENTILKLIKLKPKNQTDVHAQNVFKRAAQIGYESKDVKKCKAAYKKCRFTDRQMERILRVF